MKVVILCGGRGIRFREETDLRPKPLIEVGGNPILWHIMKLYARYGHREFILCLGYRGDMIKNYFLQYHLMNSNLTLDLSGREPIRIHNANHREDWKVTLVDTGVDAMTGARIKRIEPYVDSEPFMLTYGDGVANVDLDVLLKRYQAVGRIGMVTGVHPSSRFGELLVDGEIVREFSEKPQIHQGYINGGFFVLDRRIFNYVVDDDACVFEREPLERLAADRQLAIYRHDGYWQCMDTYRDWQMLNNAWERNEAPWKVWIE